MTTKSRLVQPSILSLHPFRVIPRRVCILFILYSHAGISQLKLLMGRLQLDVNPPIMYIFRNCSCIVTVQESFLIVASTQHGYADAQTVRLLTGRAAMSSASALCLNRGEHMAFLEDRTANHSADSISGNEHAYENCLSSCGQC